MQTGRVQRLKRPPTTEWQAKVTQAFGGQNLLLKDQGWKVLQKIFDFDYMGAAEYEFGAIPNCFREMIQKRKDYEAFKFTILAGNITPGVWRDNKAQAMRRREIKEAKRQGVKPPRLNRKKLEEKAKLDVVTDKDIFVIGPKGRQMEIHELIRAVADRKMYTKNGAGMDRALDPEGAFDRETVGWLDLDNKMLWFLEEPMWLATQQMFKSFEDEP